MHDSRTVANEFLRLAEERHTGLTPTQLLKLVYIAHGWSLALLGKPLIGDEIQAWQYGPVIPRLYRAVRDFRNSYVTGPLATNGQAPLSGDEKDLIKQVFDVYGSKGAAALSRLTHAPGSPWAQTFEEGTFGIPIDDPIIKAHYEKLAKARAA